MINEFEKLLKQNNMKYISKIATPIFLFIYMHIGLTRFLEFDVLNAKYSLNKNFIKDIPYRLG